MNLIKKLPTLLLLMLWMHFAAFGQTMDQSGESLLIKGDRLFVKGNYIEAEACYAELTKAGSNDVDVLKRLGVVKVFNRKYKDAIEILSPIVLQSDSVDYFVTYQLGRAFQNTMDYSRARELYSISLNDSALAERSKLGISQSEYAENLSSPSGNNIVVTKEDSIAGTAANKLAPHIILDTLFIYSTDMSKGGDVRLFNKAERTLCYSIVREGSLSGGQKLNVLSKSDIVKSDGWKIIVNYEGEERFLYQSAVTGQLGLSVYNRSDQSGLTPQQMGSFDPASASVVILPNNRKAYYVKQEIINGKRVNNIFVAVRDSAGNWQETGRLCDRINSEYNEDFLFWNEEEGALYFSSDRLESAGGYDIFRADEDEQGHLKPPVNLGFPINTAGNEICFYKSGDIAWYSSDYLLDNFDIFRATYTTTPPAPAPRAPWFVEYSDHGDSEKIGQIATCRNFYYDTYSNEVDTAGRAYKELLNALRSDRELRVRLTGYADWTGNAEENAKISFERVSRLFFSLVMDGVRSDQLTIDFKGSSEPLTPITFENKELLEKAKAVNRCVTVMPLGKTHSFLHVIKEKELEGLLLEKEADSYAIMLNISEKPLNLTECGLSPDTGSFKQDELYFYHTQPSGDLIAVAEEFRSVKEAHPGCYIFKLD